MARYDVVLVRRVQAVAAAPTMVEVAPIDSSHLSWTQTVNAPGMVEVGCTVDALDPDARLALLDLSDTPCELWVYRDAVQVHAGPITDYEISGRSLKVISPGLLGYVDYMIRDTEYTANPRDQATIVADLIGEYQAQDYGNFGIDVGHLAATGIMRSLELPAAELSPITRVLADLGANDDGFELDIDPASRRLAMYSPQQGLDRSASVFLTSRSIGDPKYSQHVGAGTLASAVAVTATWSNGVSASGSAEDAGLLATFGRVMVSAAFQDIPDSSTVTTQAQRLLARHLLPFHQVTAGLIAVPGFDVGDFAKGDTITYEYDAGLGTQTFALRVKTIEVTTDSGVEQMSVGFF